MLEEVLNAMVSGLPLLIIFPEMVPVDVPISTPFTYTFTLDPV